MSEGGGSVGVRGRVFYEEVGMYVGNYKKLSRSISHFHFYNFGFDLILQEAKVDPPKCE